MSEKYAFWVTLRPQSDHCHQGEAEVRTLYFKTTWSEFQKASQTTTEGGKAKLCILNFSQSSRGPVRPILSKAAAKNSFYIQKLE